MIGNRYDLEKITIFKKVTIITIDVLLWRFIWFIVSESFGIGISSQFGQDYDLFFNILSYLLYFLLPEYVFKKTLGMKIMGVRIVEPDDLGVTEFLKYAILSFMDRTLFYIIHILQGVFNDSTDKLLFSEKYSGFRLYKIIKVKS